MTNCVICQKEIKNKTRAIQMIDIKSYPDKINKTEFYHYSCFEEVMKPRGMAMNMLARAGALLNRVEIAANG